MPAIKQADSPASQQYRLMRIKLMELMQIHRQRLHQFPHKLFEGNHQTLPPSYRTYSARQVISERTYLARQIISENTGKQN